MKTKRFDLSRYSDLDVLAITFKSINGEDTLEAASRCIAPNGAQIDSNLFMLMMRQQLVAQSIVEYELADPQGERKVVSCSGPCVEVTKWSSRTREFLGEIFDHLNSVTNEEREDFRSTLVRKLTPGSSVATSVK